ncbi:hypothetical protein PG996_004284 [Apiospora saccharicola]|uniref:Uncharacterized protein n=1 Tax=Apiospora saccharicola TaxID=335842 RepID=A0ABR1W3P2_9PEZI
MNAFEIQCAKSIAHLSMLRGKRSLSVENPLVKTRMSDKDYRLKFTDEESLTHTLAFISSISDVPGYVTAVCIKETRNLSLDVLLAINKGQPDDGEAVLNRVKYGFEDLFSTLCNASTESTNNEDRVYDAILTMCYDRILRRLKLRGPKRGKLNIKEMLMRGRESIRETEKSLELFPLITEAKKVEGLVDGWLAEPTRSNLKVLIEGLDGLKRLKDPCNKVEDIPDTTQFPLDMRGNLINIIDKVTYYWKCAVFLCQLWGKYLLYGQVKVVLVCLPPNAFDGAPAKHRKANLASKILRRKPESKDAKGLKSMCRLKIPESANAISDASQELAEKAEETLKEGKVHAEIQLLFHCYELDKMESPPRVVCSNKDACYLCNAFISMHGKLYTPKSHGRLYHLWRLPRTENIELHWRFVKHLEGLIRKNVLLPKKGKRRFSCESSLGALQSPSRLCSSSNEMKKILE